jgi:DNA-binding transcriptional MerR regulator
LGGEAGGLPVSGGDTAMILERMEQMHEELYRTYADFEETKMELQERLKTRWKDYLQEGEQQERNRIIGLREQGYSLEQIKKQLVQESAQTPP